jgi:hypothetical protein
MLLYVSVQNQGGPPGRTEEKPGVAVKSARKMVVYVQLLNEGSPTYRPTEGEEAGPDVVRLLPTPNYDPDDETWEFEPGVLVRVAPMKLPSGEVPVALAPLDEQQHRCRVCGLRIGDFVPWEELRQHAGHNVCPCCGVRWGTDDTLDISCRRFRETWVAKGTPWARPEKRPTSWSPDEQLTFVPPAFK